MEMTVVRFPTSTQVAFVTYLKNRLKARVALADEYTSTQVLEVLLISEFSVDRLLREVDKLDRIKLLGEGEARWVSCENGWRVRFNVISVEEEEDLELRNAMSVREA
jgi:hypothetical protein